MLGKIYFKKLGFSYDSNAVLRKDLWFCSLKNYILGCVTLQRQQLEAQKPVYAVSFKHQIPPTFPNIKLNVQFP